MAANYNVTARTLTINVENGVNADGSARVKAYTYSGIDVNATADNMALAGNALASLMDSPLSGLATRVTSEILEA